MYDRARALDLIERAIDTDPFCPACEAPTEIVDTGGLVVLRCTAAADPNGFLARIGAVLLPHLRMPVVDLTEGVAA